MPKNDHLTYLELIYYGLDCQNGVRYSNYNKSSQRRVDREVRICPKCDKVYEIYNVGQAKYIQFNYEDFPRYGKGKEKCAICRLNDGEKVFFTWDRGGRTDIPIDRFRIGYKARDVRNKKIAKRPRSLGVESTNNRVKERICQKKKST